MDLAQAILFVEHFAKLAPQKLSNGGRTNILSVRRWDFREPLILDNLDTYSTIYIYIHMFFTQRKTNAVPFMRNPPVCSCLASSSVLTG